METGPWPHLDRRQERGVVWGGRHRFPLEVPANFGELRIAEVRRISIPRTPVNRARRRAGAATSPGPHTPTPLRRYPRSPPRTTGASSGMPGTLGQLTYCD